MGQRVVNFRARRIWTSDVHKRVLARSPGIDQDVINIAGDPLAFDGTTDREGKPRRTRLYAWKLCLVPKWPTC
jgi:hypothetical protein